MIHWMSRDGWSGDGLPRLGYWVDPSERTSVTIHHTVTVDRDETPMVWEGWEEVAAHMRRLQTIRPDLGLDVPYNVVAFAMADGGLILAEGRGLYRTAAHHKGKNRSGIGIALVGDFENRRLPARIEDRLRWLGEWIGGLAVLGFTRLGEDAPHFRQVYGHRDLKATACPGSGLYPLLGLVRWGER